MSLTSIHGQSSSRRILHLVTDPSFVAFTAMIFEEAAPGENLFVGIGTSFEGHDLPSSTEKLFVNDDHRGRRQVAVLAGSSQIIIAHGMKTSIASVFASAPSSTCKVWSGWGQDYYGAPHDRSFGTYGPQTKLLVASTSGLLRRTRRIALALQAESAFRAASKSADVFSAPVPDDLEVFKNRFPGFRGEYSQLNYVSMEDSLADRKEGVLGPDILVGNSASPANNHLEVFSALRKLDLEGRRVIVPLSYGDQRYATEIIKIGREWFGGKFIPLREFLPNEEFNRTMLSCGVVINGSLRQMAMGTILRAVWQGSRIYLDPGNPIFRFLSRNGVEVQEIEALVKDGVQPEALSAETVGSGRKFLLNSWSRSTAIENAKRLLERAHRGS